MELVSVRLSEVPQELRLRAADMLIQKSGLTTYAALELSMAAAQPLQDPVLLVPAEKAHLVLVDHRFPAGQFPVFG